MTKKPDFDVKAAHKYFAAHCFNQAWGLIDKTDRTPQEDEQMIRLNMTSTWHWTQRDDCTDKNLSIGYWQAARIFAILGDAVQARKYGEMCLAYSQGEDIGPFFLGYAYEALARAEAIAGNDAEKDKYITLAYQAAEGVSDADSKKALLEDLTTI